MKTKTKITGLVLVALALPPTASAHVTLQPEEAPAGTFTRLDVRVPNERDDAGTSKVDVELPDGFYFASYEPAPGWEIEVKREQLPEPVEIEPGFEATEQVKRITWTATGEEAVIPPGAFQDFGLSVRTPDEPGEALTFKALQTYEGGEVVRWIGAPDSEEPAPQVTLVEGAEGGHAAAATEPGEAEEEAAAAAAAEDDEDSDGLSIAAIVVGGLGLLTGGTALARSRRS